MTTPFWGGEPELAAADFDRIRGLLYEVCGINLQPGKEGLVRSRLARRMRSLGLGSYEEYFRHVTAEPSRKELAEMVDALTTNKTSFFRESAHFDFLRSEVLRPALAAGRAVTIWSAGCSSGEEPYTIAMLALEEAAALRRPAGSIRVLATDISARVLARAKEGVYAADQVAEVPEGLRQRHFARFDDGVTARFRVADATRALVKFARLNLMDAWPMRGPFDAILCRNVMIYFDKDTQQRLVARYHELLAPGGHLFVGHSESLTALAHAFAYVQPALYRKGDA